MKRYITVLFLFCALALTLSSYGQNTTNMNTTFKTPQEAANKGKADLLEVLKSGRDLNLGISAEELAKATPGKPITRKQLNFDRLLNLENVKTLKSIESAELNTIVPLMLNGKVVTIIEVRQTADTWIVAGLGNMSLSKDLNLVLKSAGQEELVVYEVPNLQYIIYTAVNGENEQYFANISEKKSLRAPIPRAELFSKLEASAKDFQAQWGERIKTERLVK